MTNTAQTTKALRLRRSAARKSRVALATALVAVGLVAPPLLAGLVAPPAHAATTTNPPVVVNSKLDWGDLDPNDGVCDVSAATSVDCTLRAAIQVANARTGPDEIDFSVPEGFRDPTTGVVTIKPNSELPAITAPVTIDGYTQPGAKENTLLKGTNASPKIALDGTNVTALNHQSGLQLIGASGSVIRGLVINRFQTGIVLEEGTVDNRIQGNFIGTDPSGTQALGNNYGLYLLTSGNTIGGTTPASRNVVSGNDAVGIYVGAGEGNRVLGNLIGADASGSGALGNDEFGVGLSSFASGNRIGNGTSAGSNTVAFNGYAGIAAGGGAVRNPISRNSVFNNVGLGIDLLTGDFLGVTPNDPGDADVGANGLQNFPVITSAKSSSTATAISGKLNSAPGDTYTIEFYSNPSFTGEGKAFVGKKTVTTGSSGNATFVFKPASRVPVGRAITATATDASGNTSEFSAPRQVAKG